MLLFESMAYILVLNLPKLILNVSNYKQILRNIIVNVYMMDIITMTKEKFITINEHLATKFKYNIFALKSVNPKVHNLLDNENIVKLYVFIVAKIYK